MSIPELRIDPGMPGPSVTVALLWATGIAHNQEESTAPAYLEETLREVKERGEEYWPHGLKESVRDVLRYGHYKPSGRAKPASEFLLRSALDDVFPVISTLVNINNVVSLQSGYPASILDMDLSGTELLLRRGLEGESYLFNHAGHEIQLHDLLVVCRRQGGDWAPCANPVKDSMATKVSTATRNALAVLFAPAEESLSRLEQYARLYEHLLREEAKAASTGFVVIGGLGPGS